MKLKKPTLRGKKGYKYLGHFAKDKNIQAGHNNIIGSILMNLIQKKLSDRIGQSGAQATTDAIQEGIKKIKNAYFEE